MTENKPSDISAENPETENEDAGSLMTVGDLIEQLQQFDPSMEARCVILTVDEDEGTEESDSYPIMYLEKMTDNEPESETQGKEFIGVVSDLRIDLEEDDDEGDDEESE